MTRLPNDSVPFVSGASFASATELLLEASRNLLAASSARPIASREIQYTASGVERGVLSAMRRMPRESDPWSRTPILRGTSYGRLGASLVGGGQRASSYGQIGGVIGYAVGGPVGGIIGGMLGGLFGGRRDRRRAAEEAERRSWLNPPEWFEIQAYLYNMSRGGLRLRKPQPREIVVNLGQGAIQITGQGATAGEAAARAFAGKLGHALALNSVLAPGASDI